MLTTKLSRAQLELHAHRTWLRTFSLHVNTSAPFGTTQARADPRPNLVRRVLREDTRKPPKNIPFAQRKRKEKDGRIADWQREIATAGAAGDFDAAMVAYRSIQDKSLLVKPVLASLIQNMANSARAQLSLPEHKQDQEANEKLQLYAEEVLQDMYKGALGPDPWASAHLIYFFIATRTWDVATQFWKWLEAKGDDFVNGDVYGAAITLLAAQDAKLEDLEALYQQGMSRLDVGFASYHFSPGAIVPNRNVKFALHGLPTQLLHAIMSARSMRGDAQNAYLALDTFLRLNPVGALNYSFYDFSRERPVSEAYTVFAMACKAGGVVPKNIYRQFLSLLRDNADVADVQRYMLTVRAMLSATYLYIGAGGQLTRNPATELIIVLTSILRIRGVYGMSDEHKLRLSQAVQELISMTLELASRFGTGPTVAAYNSIIANVAPLGQTEATITAAIRDARVQGLEPTTVTRRSILVAAGAAKDAELVAKGWRWLSEARVAQGHSPDLTDLHILTKACVQAGNDDFAENVIQNSNEIEDWQRENLLERLWKKTDLPGSFTPPANIDGLLAEVSKIKDDLEVFDHRTSDAKGVQDFSSQVVPMLLFPTPKDVRLPEAEMRKLYDQLTTDPDAPEASTVNPPLKEDDHFARGTRVPFGQLRYESWKHITYLLAEAETRDKAYISAVDSAIAKGKAPPQRNHGLIFQRGDRTTAVGLSDPVQEIEVGDQEIDVEKARVRICELRKVELPKPKAQDQV